MRQPTLFEQQTKRGAADAERIVLFALGDFQARGKVLAERDLPLDRLRGALRRSTDAHDREELSDQEAVAAFRALGAEVRQVPPFVAKHPFRVTVSSELAERSRRAYNEILDSLKED
ncbi:MAG TPA: hypothetical protein VJT09_19135 [Pyrinomonadaceae bacterium]|nr:hypothetical protein [Pyrinomonadaceae bacterium]